MPDQPTPPPYRPGSQPGGPHEFPPGQDPAQGAWQHGQWGPQYPPAPPVPEKPRRSWFRRHKITTALLAIVGLAIVGSALSGGEEGTPPAVSEPQDEAPAEEAPAASATEEGTAADAEPTEEEPTAEDPTQEEEAPAEEAPGLGDAVRDGQFEFVVSEVEPGLETVGADFIEEEAQGQFVLVTLSVTNIGDDAQYFSDSEQTLVDDQGREHSTSSAGMFLEDNDLWLQEINPGNTAEGVIVFDIPADATPVELELHDSIFSDGVVVALP